MFRASPERVDIWRVDLRAGEATSRGLLLSEEEKQRAARFHFERDRVRWSLAHSALRSVLASYTGTSPLELTFATGEHGKPSLVPAGVEFNLSHSGGWALIAVSRHSAVGVDVEQIRPGVDIAKLLARIGEQPAGEQLFQQWALREARTKAAGIPLMQAPAEDVYATPLNAPEGFAAAVALVGAQPEPVYCGV